MTLETCLQLLCVMSFNDSSMFFISGVFFVCGLVFEVIYVFFTQLKEILKYLKLSSLQIIWNKWHQIYMYIKRMSLASSCLKISTWYWHIWTNLVFCNCNCFIHVCTGLICTLIYTCSFCKAIDKHHSQARKQDYLLGGIWQSTGLDTLMGSNGFPGQTSSPSFEFDIGESSCV